MVQVKISFARQELEHVRKQADSRGLSFSRFVASRALAKRDRPVPDINVPVMRGLVDVGNHLNIAVDLLRAGASHDDVEAALTAAAVALRAAANGESEE